MVIQGVRAKATPVGGASTGWQVSVLTTRKDGTEYWKGIERYPTSVLGAAMAVLEFDAVNGGESEVAELVRVLTASCESIRRSVEGAGR